MSAQPWPGPGRILVDLDAISDNVASLRARTPGAELLAVVKADAYGHGLLPCAHAALRGGAQWLGTALLPEALALRAAGVDAPLLSWLHGPGDDFDAAVAVGIDLGISHEWALQRIEEAARTVGQIARVHLKVDTGLARNGALGAGALTLFEQVARAQERGWVRAVGLMSHLARADEPGHPSIAAQADAFDALRERAAAWGLSPLLAHLANSAAYLTRPELSYDLARIGLAMYGLSPVPQVGDPTDFGLRPAMRVVADISLVKPIPAGQGVSYGHRYAPPTDTRIALVPMGYADGVPRHASGVGPINVGGQRHTIAGTVCMDQVVLDIGDLPVEVGDEAVLIGDALRGEPTAQEWAQACGTISYEIVTRMSGRLPRLYLGGGVDPADSTELQAEVRAVAGATDTRTWRAGGGDPSRAESTQPTPEGE